MNNIFNIKTDEHETTANLYFQSINFNNNLLYTPPETNIIINFSNHYKEMMPWECYLLKNKKEIVYIPSKIESVPNFIQRFMLKTFFGIVWAKRK